LDAKIEQDIIDANMPGGPTRENKQLVLGWIQEETRGAFADAFRAEFLGSPRASEKQGVIDKRTQEYWDLRRTEGLTDREARERLHLPETVLSLLKPDEAAKLEEEWLQKAGVPEMMRPAR
jgi:hypothetical protein